MNAMPPDTLTWPTERCWHCASLGCAVSASSEHGTRFYCTGSCASADEWNLAAGRPSVPVAAQSQEHIMPDGQSTIRRPRAPFSIGEIEDVATVPIAPRTPSERLAAALATLPVGKTIAFAGISLATARRVAKAWTARQAGDVKPALRVDMDADGVRVRVWRTV